MDTELKSLIVERLELKSQLAVIAINMNLGTHDRLDELSPQRLNTIRSR
jgi:hypothetical protein